MNFNNLVEPIVSSYLYTNVYNSQEDGETGEKGAKKEKMTGGYPVVKLYNTINPNKKYGGKKTLSASDETDEGESNGHLENYIVPVGLVYISSSCHNRPNYYSSESMYSEFTNKPSHHQLIHPVSNDLYDILVDTIAYNDTKKHSREKNVANKSKKAHKANSAKHKKTVKHK